MTASRIRFTERQLPKDEEIFLDHVGHYVPDAEAAAKAMAQAGFAPTPISIQTDQGQRTGTGNVTAMLARGYIEVLFKTADTPLGREFETDRTRYDGVHLAAFGTPDARAAQRRLQTAGFRTRPIVDLRRPVKMENGGAEAAFTVARAERGEMREGRMQYLTHLTEDAVWQKRWLTHPNGADALIDVMIAVADVDEAAARYTRFLGRGAIPTNLGHGIFLDRGGVQLMNATNFVRAVPDLAIPSLPFIGAYAVRVASLAQTERALNLATARHGNVLIAPFPAALGIGAWLFVERVTDLPWGAKS